MTGHRAMLAGPVLALCAVLAAVAVTHAAGFAFRDPDHVTAGYVAMVGSAMVVLAAADTWLRARREGRPVRAVRRDRWTPARVTAAASGLLSFYATYLAYRNVKAALPLLRRARFDGALADADHALLAGHDPAAVLHALIGTGVQTQVLSGVYVGFIVFLPLSLAVALVFVEQAQAALFVAFALSLNWVLGAASYYLLPSLGPVYVHPEVFAALPHTEVTHLQRVLLEQRRAFLLDPTTGTPQSIAAFASLHISMSFTAVLAARLLGLRAWLQGVLAAWLALTFAATVYFGWHYVVDDLAGLVLGALAVAGARAVVRPAGQTSPRAESAGSRRSRAPAVVRQDPGGP